MKFYQLILLILLPLYAFSQSEFDELDTREFNAFLPATFIMRNGDTIQGKMKHTELALSKFKALVPSSNGYLKMTKLKARDIDHIWVDEHYYRSVYYDGKYKIYYRIVNDDELSIYFVLRERGGHVTPNGQRLSKTYYNAIFFFCYYESIQVKIEDTKKDKEENLKKVHEFFDRYEYFRSNSYAKNKNSSIDEIIVIYLGLRAQFKANNPKK